VTGSERGRSYARDESPDAYPGGGYQREDGLWVTDRRSRAEVRSDAIWLLICLFATPLLVLGAIWAVLSWLM
jgi:hypothetical protein